MPDDGPRTDISVPSALERAIVSLLAEKLEDSIASGAHLALNLKTVGYFGPILVRNMITGKERAMYCARLGGNVPAALLRFGDRRDRHRSAGHHRSQKAHGLRRAKPSICLPGAKPQATAGGDHAARGAHQTGGRSSAQRTSRSSPVNLGRARSSALPWRLGLANPLRRCGRCVMVRP